MDQNPLIRDGLSILIGLQDDMELAGLAVSGLDAVQRFAEHRPDVTLIDLDLPAGAGIAAIREIGKIDPAACVIGTITCEIDSVVKAARSAGARDCVTKDRLNADLLSLVRACPPDAG